MTDATSPTIRPPRIVIEAGLDGTLSAEYYINGARTKLPLPRGFEMPEIRQILANIAADIAAQAARIAAKKEAEERARHARIYWHSVHARGQGQAFADRVIGKPKRSANANANASSEAKGPKPLVADASLV